MENISRLLIILFALSIPINSNAIIIGYSKVESVASGGFVGNSDNTNEVAFDSVDNANEGIIFPFTSTSGGTVTGITMRVDPQGSGNINIGLYSSDGNTKHAEGDLTAVTTGAQTLAISFDSSYSISNSTGYLIVVGSNDLTDFRLYFSDSSSVAYRRKVSMTIGDTMPSTVDPSGGVAGVGGYVGIIYADDTP